MSKRTILTLLAATVMILQAAAQTVTTSNLSREMRGAKINFKMDFTNAEIYGMTESEFAEYEKDWNSDNPTIVRNCRKAVGLTVRKLYDIGTHKGAAYTLSVIVTKVTDEGFIICNATLTDSKGTVLFSVEDLTGGNEPTFSPGTKLAKMKVWSALVGRKLGSILKKEAK